MDSRDGVMAHKRNAARGGQACKAQGGTDLSMQEQQQCKELCPAVSDESSLVWTSRQTNTGDLVVGVS